MLMNTAMARKPQVTEWKPFEMFSAPRLGPMVRSSMMSIGAASAPARSSSARSPAFLAEPMPVIWKRLPSSDWMVATVRTSPLPFSKSTTAMGLWMFLRETSRRWRPPASFRLTATAGCWCSSKVAEALVSCWPVKMGSRRSTTGAPRPWRNRSEPKGTTPFSLVRARWASGLMSTSRASSVAVRPRMSLARAVSCTPGSCTTIRSAPWRWMTGSATPSSLIRLFSVVMFCCTELSRKVRMADSVSVSSSCD